MVDGNGQLEPAPSPSPTAAPARHAELRRFDTAQTVGGAKSFTSPVNTTTQYNIGAGAGSRVLALTGGKNSVAVGVDAGTNNTGFNNAFVGTFAGQSNTTGGGNAFVGTGAGQSNTTGEANAFVGADAGFDNTTGFNNAFVGALAGQSNVTGNNNAFVGTDAGQSNTTGGANAFVGRSAGFNNTTGNNNVALGNGAGQNLTTGDSNIAIGNTGVAADANTTRIGTTGTQTRAFIAGIANNANFAGARVVVDASGQLGTAAAPEYGYIYNTLFQAVFPDADIAFEANGVLSAGITHAPNAKQITVATAGDYMVKFIITSDQANKFTLFRNGATVPGADYGASTANDQKSGQVIVTLVAGDVLTIRNSTSSIPLLPSTVNGAPAPLVNASVLLLKLN